MENYADIISEIEEMSEDLRRFMDKAYAQYSGWGKAVLRDEITDLRQIEKIMDGLCDLGQDARFRELYEMLTRHLYTRHPQLIGEHAFCVWRKYVEIEGENDGR